MTTATRPMTLDEFLAMPETEPASEFICGEGLPSTRQRPGDMITAAPVLPNFTLDVGELFAALDD